MLNSNALDPRCVSAATKYPHIKEKLCVCVCGGGGVQRKRNSRALRELLYESVVKQVWKKDTKTRRPSPRLPGRGYRVCGGLILSRRASSVSSQRHLVTLKCV